MALVVPNSFGELEMLKYIVGLVHAGNPILHLYTTYSADPTDSIVKGSLPEVSVSGYAPVTLYSTNWVVSQTSGVTTASYAEQTFSFNTNVQVYGYYVTDSSDDHLLLWLEKFSGAPFSIPTGGGTISITARLTLS